MFKNELSLIIAILIFVFLCWVAFRIVNHGEADIRQNANVRAQARAILQEPNNHTEWQIVTAKGILRKQE